MSVISANSKPKRKVTCHVPTGNQFTDVKPIEVKCFLDQNQITVETNNEKSSSSTTTAKVMTVVPQRKRPISAPIKKAQVVMDTVIAKPIRHLAILPTSNKETMKPIANLSETFTLYEGPSTTPALGRSLDETITLTPQEPVPELNFDFALNENVNPCDSTTVSSVCELIDQPALQRKPHSLIGRYQSIPSEASSKPPLPPQPPPSSLHLATVYYGSNEPTEQPVNKQALVQQFYTQLEKMKATFNTEPASSQITTKTLTFDDNQQVQQISTTKELHEKIPVRRISSATVPLRTKKSLPRSTTTTTTTTTTLPKKPRPIIKNSSTRIQSAPVTMTTQIKKTKPSNPISSCKSQRVRTLEKKPSADQIESTPLPMNHIEYRQNDVTLLPHEEKECQKMFDKLQRLQPNGVCVDINTLRRALYPPMGTTTYSSNLNHISAPAPFKSYRSRTDEMPQSWVKVDDKYVSQYVPKLPSSAKTETTSSIILPEDTDIDRITDQLKKHAAINYSYYTRTK